MHPTPLLARGWEDLLQRGPEPHGPVPGGQFRSGQTARLEVEKHFAPALRAFTNAVLNGEKMLLAPCVDTDDDQNAEPIIGAAQTATWLRLFLHLLMLRFEGY